MTPVHDQFTAVMSAHCSHGDVSGALTHLVGLQFINVLYLYNNKFVGDLGALHSLTRLTSLALHMNILSGMVFLSCR